MIKSYLNEINEFFEATEKNYKDRLRVGVSDEQLQLFQESINKIEQATSYKIKGDLHEFLEWSCLSRVYAVPFIPFVSSGSDFRVWAHRAEVIVILLNNPRNRLKNGIQIMAGKYVDNGEEKIFSVTIDTSGVVTGNKGGMVIDYGYLLPGYGDALDETKPIERQTIASNITDFTQQYLKYLQTLDA